MTHGAAFLVFLSLLLQLVYGAKELPAQVVANYIWINRTNVHNLVVPGYFEPMALSVSTKVDKALTPKYHFYRDIYAQLRVYDSELALYFSRINRALPALLSDIGRFIILYNHGGFYHDARFTLESKEALRELLSFCKMGVDVVFHQKIPKLTMIKSTNMLACKKKAAVFDAILQQQKLKLRHFFDSPTSEKVLTNETIAELTMRTFASVFVNQSVCTSEVRPTVCVHNHTALLATRWKLIDHRTREYYNYNQLHWSRTNLPLFVDFV